MIPPESPYWGQVRLLLDVMPAVAEEACFALKGGTAINFFVRDLPRLSVDIDLAYLPVEERGGSLRAIDEALRRIAGVLSGYSPAYEVALGDNERSGLSDTLSVRDRSAQIKIEVNPVLRGAVRQAQRMQVRPVVEERIAFGEMQVLDFNDLYAGKLMAALDRQHPRDLFDVMVLFEHEGITDDLFRTWLVYLIGHKGNIADTLIPNRKDIRALYESQFLQMANREVGLDELEAARERLILELHRWLGDREKRFLLSVKRGQPEWDLLGIPGVDQLPAVKWKLHNIGRMSKAAHAHAVANLEKTLSGIK